MGKTYFTDIANTFDSVQYIFNHILETLSLLIIKSTMQVPEILNRLSLEYAYSIQYKFTIKYIIKYSFSVKITLDSLKRFFFNEFKRNSRWVPMNYIENDLKGNQKLLRVVARG